MSDTEQNIDRRPDGRFLPGQSGNPAGRTKSANALLKERLANEGEQVIAIVIKSALAGDMMAARMILDRIVPPLKATAAPANLSLPAVTTPLAVAEALLRAVSRGELPPDVAAQLLTATAQFSKIVEIEDLTARLEAIERATKPKTPTKPKR